VQSNNAIGRRFANTDRLWLLSLGIFDKAYAKRPPSTDEHKYRSDLFTAETPLGASGMTDQMYVAHTRRLPNRAGSTRLNKPDGWENDRLYIT
jgi:hypothetical protein